MPPPPSSTTVIKACGHACYPSSVDRCCRCADQRPVRVDGTYPTYTDGVGRTNNGRRDKDYCPVCCPTNRVRWEKKMAEEASRVAARLARLAAKEEQAARARTEDRARAVGAASGPFTFQNGDCYEGDMCEGEPHGRGRMTYAEDGTIYDGHWRRGRHDGQGTKSYLDGIEYTGAFKDGMMHGTGRFTMGDGTVLDGEFLEDEWQGG